MRSKNCDIRDNKKSTLNGKPHPAGPPITQPPLLSQNNKCIYDLWSEIDTYNGFCMEKLNQSPLRVRLRRLLDMINNPKLLVKGETFISSSIVPCKYLKIIWQRIIRSIVYDLGLLFRYFLPFNPILLKDRKECVSIKSQFNYRYWHWQRWNY